MAKSTIEKVIEMQDHINMGMYPSDQHNAVVMMPKQELLDLLEGIEDHLTENQTFFREIRDLVNSKSL